MARSKRLLWPTPQAGGKGKEAEAAEALLVIGVLQRDGVSFVLLEPPPNAMPDPDLKSKAKEPPPPERQSGPASGTL